MADGDRIIIAGFEIDVAKQGGFATEQTLDRLAKAMEKMSGGATQNTAVLRQGLGKIASQQTKLSDAQKTSADIFKEIGSKQTKVLQDQSKLDKDRNRLFGNLRDAMGTAARQSYDKTVKGLQEPKGLGVFGKALGTVTSKLGVMGAAIGGLATAIGALVAKIVNISDQYLTLFRQGFVFQESQTAAANGLMQVADMSSRMFISTDRFVELVSTFSTTVGIVGMKRFADLNARLINTTEAVGQFGLSQEALISMSAEYMDTMRATGVLTRMNNQQIHQGTMNFVAQNMALTSLTKQTVDTIQKIAQQTLATDSATNYLMSLGEAGAEAADSLLLAGSFAGALGNEIGGPLSQMISEAVGRQGAAYSELARSTIAASGEFYQGVSGIAEAVRSGGDVQGAFNDLITSARNLTDADFQRLRALEMQGDAQAAYIIKFNRMVRNIPEEEMEMLAGTLDDLRSSVDPDETSKAFLLFSTAMNKVRSAFTNLFVSIFGNTKIMKGMSAVIDTVQDALSSFANYLTQRDPETGQTRVEKLIGFLGDMIQKFIDYIKNIIDAVSGFGKSKEEGGGFMKSLKDTFVAIFAPIIKAIGDAIKFAIVGAWEIISMDLPTWMGGKGGKENVFEDEILKPQKELANAKALEVDGIYGSEADVKRQEDILKRREENLETAKNRPTERKSIFSIGKIYDQDEVDKAQELVDQQKQRVEDTKANNENAKKQYELAQKALNEESEKKFKSVFPEYDYQKSIDAGELVKKAVEETTDTQKKNNEQMVTGTNQGDATATPFKGLDDRSTRIINEASLNSMGDLTPDVETQTEFDVLKEINKNMKTLIMAQQENNEISADTNKKTGAVVSETKKTNNNLQQ